MSEATPSPRPWSCPSCGRRVPARAAVCHCGMTRDRALELAAAAPESPSAPGAGRAPADMPADVRALLAGAALVVVVGLGWAAFAPVRRDTTPPVLGWVDPGPPDPKTLSGRAAPQPPFRMPWWK